MKKLRLLLFVVILLCTTGCCIDTSGVLPVTSGRGCGTAFVIDRKGYNVYAMTCEHVVSVLNKNGDMRIDGYKAHVVYTNKKADIALIRFESNDNYPIYRFGSTRIGDKVALVGFPTTIRSLILGAEKHIHIGFVSFLNEKTVRFNGGLTYGFSGSPLFNCQGEVIGIADSVAFGPGGIVETIGSFSRASYVKKLLEDVGLL